MRSRRGAAEQDRVTVQDGLEGPAEVLERDRLVHGSGGLEVLPCVPAGGLHLGAGRGALESQGVLHQVILEAGEPPEEVADVVTDVITDVAHCPNSDRWTPSTSNYN